MRGDEQQVLLFRPSLALGLSLGLPFNKRFFPGNDHLAYLLVLCACELCGEPLLVALGQLYIGVDNSGQQKPLADVESFSPSDSLVAAHLLLDLVPDPRAHQGGQGRRNRGYCLLNPGVKVPAATWVRGSSALSLANTQSGPEALGGGDGSGHP